MHMPHEWNAQSLENTFPPMKELINKNRIPYILK